MQKKETIIEKNTYFVDATDKILGRLATKIADILRGKNRADYAPNRDDLGSSVVVTNARNIKLTGNKIEKKVYYHHSGYPGGLKEKRMKDLMGQNPSEVIKKAVYSMLPKNKLRDRFIKKLNIFSGDEYKPRGDEIKLET